MFPLAIGLLGPSERCSFPGFPFIQAYDSRPCPLLALAMQPPTSPADTTAAAAPAAAEAPAATPADDDCLMCHSDKELTTTLGNGETRSLFVDPRRSRRRCTAARWAASTATPASTRCRTDDELPDEARRLGGVPEQCTHCHFATFKKTLDSVHHVRRRVATRRHRCTDCHGAHNVASPSKPRSRISQTCAKCHAASRRSTRRACMARHWSTTTTRRADVHRLPPIARHGGPHESDWRAHARDVRDVPWRQAGHGNGLSVAVHQTYLTDFHGVTARLGFA
jgi:predicted CXXCH cytochrome family protein